MGNRVEVWIERDILQRARGALLFQAAKMREHVPIVIDGQAEYPKEAEDVDALNHIRQLERDAERLRWLLELNDEDHTEDEQIADVKALIKELHGEGYYNHSHDGRLSKTLRNQIHQIKRTAEEAYDTFASLVDYFRVDLRALQFMVHAALEGHTHRVKNSRLYVALDAIDRMVITLSEIDPDRPGQYRWELFGGKSFDFRKLAAENFRLRKALEGKEKNDGNPDEMAQIEDEIPF